MMLDHEPVMPQRPPDELRAEVARRSAAIRTRRRRAGAALAGTALAVVVVMAAAGTPTQDVRTTPRPGAEGGAGSEAPAEASEDGTVGTPDGEGGAGSSSGPGDSGSSDSNGGSGSGSGRSPRATGSDAPAPSAPTTTGPAPAPASDADVRIVFWRQDTVYESALDGSGMRVVTRSGVPSVRLSPDGRWFFHDNTGLFVTDTHTGEQRTVFESRNDTGGRRDLAEQPVWLADSRTLAFIRVQGDSFGTTRELWVADIHTRQLRRVREAPTAYHHLSASATGRLAYECRIGEQDRVCVTDLSGADLGHVPDTVGNLGFTLSPDGRWLAYFGGSDAYFSVHVVRLDGSYRRRVVADRAIGTIEWLPDSTRVAVSLAKPDAPGPCDRPRPCPGDSGIWTVRTDGSDPRSIFGVAKDEVLGLRLAPR